MREAVKELVVINNPFQTSPGTEKTAKWAAGMMVATIAAAVIVILATGWQGRVPILEPCRPQAVQLAKDILRWGFGITVTYLGFRKPWTDWTLIGIFGAIIFGATIFLNSNMLTRIHNIYTVEAIAFALPSVFGLVLGLLTGYTRKMMTTNSNP